MIIVDGRVDEEKLRELLDWGAECAELDFKEFIDLSNKIDELKFVKDAVAMLNHYPGGYLVIGITDDGKPSNRSNNIDWRTLDSNTLTKKIEKYIDTTPEVSSQVHEIDGHKYCVICMKSATDGFPIPFNKNGQSGNEFIFREGEIIRRNGAGNACIKYSQWEEVLRQHDIAIRNDERERIDIVIEKIATAIANNGKTPPLATGMPAPALKAALEICFEHEDNKKLIRYANKLGIALMSKEDVFTEITSLAAHAVINDNEKVFSATIDTLYNFYDCLNSSVDNTVDIKLKIAVSLYEIGSVAVRSRCWHYIAPLVNRQSTENPTYTYASWIRECQVKATRAGLFKENNFGMMISAALEDMHNNPSLYPDFEVPEDTNTLWQENKEELLDSLCCFDLLYCVCVFAEGKGHGEAYPACVAFEEKRVSPLIKQLLGRSDKMRRELLGHTSDEQLALAIEALYRVIQQQAWHTGRLEWNHGTNSRIIENFIDDIRQN